MGKASKWIKNFLTGKKSSSHQPISVDTHENPKTPVWVPLASLKDKRRWSFRKPLTTATYQKELNVVDTTASMQMALEAENEQKRYAMTVAMATAAAADAAAQEANEAVMRLTYSAPGIANSVEDTAATKIQSIFRSYLARKALFALKGLVKMQALVRGYLVRKQATATFRCLQALLMVQARARARRIKMIDEPNPYNQRQSIHTKSTTDDRFTYPDPQMDHIKTVEMDMGDTRGSRKSRMGYFNNKQTDNRYSSYHHQYSKQHHQHISPSAISQKSYSGHYNELFHSTRHSSPRYDDKHDELKIYFSYKAAESGEARCNEYQFSPNYMANTKSSKAKYRSHSAPKQRPASTYQRQPSKRRASIESRNVARAVRMERSSSSTPQNSQYPCSIELDDFKDSECGSNSTMLTNSHY